MKTEIGRKRFVFAFCVVVLCLGVWVTAVRLAPLYADDDDSEFIANQVVIRIDPDSGATIDDIHADYDTATLDVLPGDIYLLQIPPGQGVRSLVNVLRLDPRLSFAQPNFVHEIPEGDPSGTWAWGGYDPAPYLNQYAADMLNLDSAHEVTLGAGVIVAVLDTGVQLDHPQLAGIFTAVQYDFLAHDPIPSDIGNGLDDDGDGLIDEGAGHGTHVAGIVNLVAPAAQIMPVRVLDSDGQGTDFMLAEAIRFATANGAHVINLSLGTPDESELLEDVIEEVTETGVVVVAAAGNLNSSSEQYPAADDNVLAVTAIGPSAAKSPFANYGEWVDVAAPGENITSTFPVNGYAQWSGTSMATAFVSGQAALIRSQAATTADIDVIGLIRSSAQPIDGLNPPFTNLLGAGLADVSRSLGQTSGADGTIVNCGQVIVASVRLLNDLTDCPGEGLVIGAEGITVDLNGRTLDGVGLGSGVRNDGFTAVIITNGTVQEFDYGVQLQNVAYNAVLSMTLQLNQDAGIELVNTSAGTVQGNTAVNNSVGIVLRQTQQMMVVGNVVQESNNTAVLLETASHNTLRHNTITNSADNAIVLLAAANHNRIEANTLIEGGDAGIFVTDSNGNEFLTNTIHQMSDSGIVLVNAHENVAMGNDLRYNAGGIELSGSTGNRIEANHASYNGGYGLEVGDHALGNTIALNTATFNGAAGIYVGAERLAENSEPGNLLEGNTANNNQSHGIFVAKAGHTLNGNTASYNTGWGIYAGPGNSGGDNLATSNVESAQCFHMACNGAPTIPSDSTPPETTIASGPSATTTQTGASFSFTANESGATFQCALDSAAFASCVSPMAYSGLNTGTHSFQVRAIDAAGNTDPTPAVHTWTISPPANCNGTVTLTAVADAWIEQNSPNNNKGDDSILKVKAQFSNDNFRALVRFPSPAVPAGCVVQSATLRLYAPSWKNGRTLQAFRLASSWSEMGVTWNNQPATAGTAVTTSSGSGYRQWNVTTQVQTMLTNGNYGFLIRDATEGGSGSEQQFHSREKGETPPQLILTFAPGG